MRLGTRLSLAALCSTSAGCAGLFESTTIPGVSAALENGLRDARAELDAGRRECAFARVEDWRRSHEQKDFRRAFEVVFLGRPPFDPSPQAELALRRELAANPTDAAAAMRLADIYISRSDWARAEPLVAQAIAIHPDDLEPVAVLARIRDAQGDQAQAQKLMTEFAERHPNFPTSILLRLGAAHGPERRRALEAAVQAHPRDGELTFALADEVQRAGDLAGAEALFVRAAELDRKSAMIQAWTARFFLKAESKRNEALDYYFRAYFLDPDYYEVEFVEARIGRMIDRAALAACNWR